MVVCSDVPIWNLANIPIIDNGSEIQFYGQFSHKNWLPIYILLNLAIADTSIFGQYTDSRYNIGATLVVCVHISCGLLRPATTLCAGLAGWGGCMCAYFLWSSQTSNHASVCMDSTCWAGRTGLEMRMLHYIPNMTCQHNLWWNAGFISVCHDSCTFGATHGLFWSSPFLSIDQSWTGKCSSRSVLLLSFALKHAWAITAKIRYAFLKIN